MTNQKLTNLNFSLGHLVNEYGTKSEPPGEWLGN